MNEHELCCGTVANKARLCAEVEQRDLRIKNLELCEAARTRVVGRTLKFAMERGYNPASEENELEYIMRRFDELLQEIDHINHQATTSIIPETNKVKLTAPGQIKRGYKIYFTYLWKPQTYRVKKVLNAGTDKEEILININQNLYFITSMAIDGSSWAKDVHFDEPPEANHAPNT